MYKVRRFLLVILAASGSLYGSTIVVTDSSVFAATKDIVYWQQLGQDTNGPSFFAYTSMNEGINGHLDNGSGTVVTVGNDNAPVAGGGFNKGDALLSTDDGTGDGTAPLTIGFNSPMYGAALTLKVLEASSFRLPSRLSTVLLASLIRLSAATVRATRCSWVHLALQGRLPALLLA
jgi:hypothetical protein